MSCEAPTDRGAPETTLREMRVDKLRHAIRKNQVSFPSQVPTFPKLDRSDVQRQVVQLYFVLGWPGPKIGARFGLGRTRVEQILNGWKRRAVDIGYIQSIPSAESLKPLSWHAPIEVTLSQVTPPAAPSIPTSRPSEINFPLLNQNQISNWTDPKRGFRPRRKFDSGRIIAVLKQLRAGRTVAEMADEVGVSACTVRIWKKQHEMLLLRRENAQLKERLARLGTVEQSLIDLIIKSDEAKPSSFMPFSRVSNHTGSDYRESL